jgi:queuine tRNA-ribosyltransferase
VVLVLAIYCHKIHSNAMAFTDAGPLRLRNNVHQRDDRPLEEGCPCLACRHSRAYLRHLCLADEMLGPILLTHHNLTYYQRLLSEARKAIEQDRFLQFFNTHMTAWTTPAASA